MRFILKKIIIYYIIQCVYIYIIIWCIYIYIYIMTYLHIYVLFRVKAWGSQIATEVELDKDMEMPICRYVLQYFMVITEHGNILMPTYLGGMLAWKTRITIFVMLVTYCWFHGNQCNCVLIEVQRVDWSRESGIIPQRPMCKMRIHFFHFQIHQAFLNLLVGATAPQHLQYGNIFTIFNGAISWTSSME